jgi:hypothetical protein
MKRPKCERPLSTAERKKLEEEAAALSSWIKHPERWVADRRGTYRYVSNYALKDEGVK